MTSPPAAEAMLRQVLDALPQGFAVFDAERRLTLANGAFHRHVGIDASMLPRGSTLRDVMRLIAFRGLFGPGDPEAQAETLLRLDRSRVMGRVSCTVDGRWFELWNSPLPDGGFILSAADITAHRRAETEAADRARLLEHVLLALRGGVALFDRDHRLILHNRSYEDLIGAPPGLIRPGVTYPEILEALRDRGEFASLGSADWVAERIQVDRARPQVAQRERPNGQVLRFASHPASDGGFLVETDDVTALKRAEDEAQRRAALLNGVLAALPHGVAVYGPDRRVALTNAAYHHIMGGAPVQVGDHMSDVIRRRAEAGEYGAGDPERIYREQMSFDLSRPQARRRVRPNGTALEVRTAPLPDGGHISVVTDITALHQAEAEASRRAAMLQVMLDSMRHGICLYDADRRLLVANPLAMRLTGLTPAQLSPGRTLDELLAIQVAAGEFDADRAATLAAMDRRRPQRYTRRRPDGTVLELASDPTPDGGFVVTYSDVTALARAEAEASRRAGLLQVMLDNIRHGICLFDAEGRVVAANALAAQMTGLRPEEMVPGASIADLRRLQIERGEFGPEPEAEAYVRERESRAWHVPERYVRTRPDGTVREVVTDATPDGGFVRTYSDVTEDRRIRAELERAKEAAEAANRAKSRFLATMSHELRTPLNAVIGFSEALMASPSPEEVPEFARAIHEAGRHLLALIDDILDVARTDRTGLHVSDTVLDPVALAESAGRVMGAEAASAGLDLVSDLAPELPKLRGDERRLRQVLLNLLSNAVKFTPRGGRVTLSARLDATTGDLLFRVTDTGIGMRPEDVPLAFEPFTQLDSSLSRRFRGSGIGLHLSRVLAEAQGGTLTLETTPGEGTTAVLRLPKARLLAHAAATTGSPA